MQCPSIRPHAYGVLIRYLQSLHLLSSLLSLFYYCCYYFTAAIKLLLLLIDWISGVVELTTQLLRLINILWLPLCRINKLGSNYP